MKLEITQLETLELTSLEYRLTELPDFYLTKLMMKANELGLGGRKIKDIVAVEDPKTGGRYIDFLCDPPTQTNHNQQGV